MFNNMTSPLPREDPSRRWSAVSLETLITIGLVGFATLFVIWNLRPGLWFENTTPTGGDMGAHVWSPAYLRDVLLPDFRLTGWSPDWYAGFPAFTFYMVIPSLFIVMINVGLGGGVVFVLMASIAVATGTFLLRGKLGPQASPGRVRALYLVAAVGWVLLIPVPYGVAMKLVVVAGLVLLPVAAWSAGRLGGLAFPGPAFMAVMTLPFLFDRSYNIYGGNLMSTMAGEFAYSLGLTFAVFYIGVAARGMQTGRHRGLAAALLALAGLTHLFAAFFGLIVTLALYITGPGKRTTKWLATMGPLSAMLAAFWVLPFLWNRSLLNDMGWGKERRYVEALWNRAGDFGGQTFLVNDPPLQLLVVVAVVGAVICGVRRIRLGMALSIVALIFASTFLLLPEGRLWNVRILPFYYLSINLMAAITVAEVGRWLARVVRISKDTPRRALIAAGPAIVVTLVLFVSLGLPLRSLPGGRLDDQGSYNWLGFSEQEVNLGPSWLTHNFGGYEGQAAWPEYSLMVSTMESVGETHGCGRALWEYESERLGSYGTPMSPMLLPYWTDSCIASMEGLYFEASATTPYHFLLQSELSASPSRAQRDLPYQGLNAVDGARHLQDLGVRYYLAFSDQAVLQARAEAAFTEIATAGPWVMFLVQDTDLVVGLEQLPVIVDGVGTGGEDWLVPTVAWWSASGVPLIAADGPSGWPQTTLDNLAESAPAFRHAIDNDLGRLAEIEALTAALPTALPTDPVDPAEVFDIVADHASISFSVDQVGQPVLVRTSYFPNWNANGADGPYRVAPNLMVVVPTDTEVSLTYGRSGIEWVANLLTLGGLLGLIVVGRRRSVGGAGTDVAWWDWTRRATDSWPGRDEILDGATLEAVSAEVAAAAAGQRRRLAVAAGVVAYSCLTFAVVSPGADEPIRALVLSLPGVVGLTTLMFSIGPSLLETQRYRKRLLGSVR